MIYEPNFYLLITKIHGMMNNEIMLKILIILLNKKIYRNNIDKII